MSALGHKRTSARPQTNAATRGRITLISVNSPGCESTSIEPPCCLTMMSWLMAIESDHTNQLVILQHRHTKYSSEFAEFNRGDRRWMTVEVGLLLLDVSYVRDLFGGRGAANRSIR